MYEFMNCHIAKDNIGEHDGDNRFLLANTEDQLSSWQEEHEGCTPVGICYEDPHPNYSGFYPMVYEDENGNRYWTHWDIASFKDAVEDGRIILSQEPENVSN